MNQLGFPLYMNDKLVPEPVTFRHQPAAGVGEYFSESVSGMGEYFSEPLGASMVEMPRQRAWKLAANVSPLLGGLGEVAAAQEQSKYNPAAAAAGASVAVVATVVVLGLLVRGVAGYYAGKAMAPRGRESKYAWGGVAASVLLGSLGLGIEGAVALSQR